MALIDKVRKSCYLIFPFTKELLQVIDIIAGLAKEAGFKIIRRDELDIAHSVAESISSQIANCDLIIADVSKPTSNIFYEIGLAHAMGKPVIFLIQKGASEIPFDLRNYLFISYDMTSAGLDELRYSLRKVFRDFINMPRKVSRFLHLQPKVDYPPYIIDLEKIEPREFENLCFELITQMGFRRVEWGKQFREIDAVATLPKKDPDGYEYQELWFISMGRRLPVDMMLEIAAVNPERFFTRMFRSSEGIEELLSRYKIRYDVPITILFVLRKEGTSDFLEHEMRRIERRFKERPYPFNIRVRWWDPTYLTNLIQQYPQIAYKYFSEESRVKSKYRKTPEVLYNENVKLAEELLAVKNLLEGEKKKRFIAERDAAWKDVAFKAAHKLGNPTDAIDIFLQSLKRRIQNSRHDEALHIADEMDASIEEAKTVIAQFKSLTKSQEISARPIDVLPLIQHACKIAEENGVAVRVQKIENYPEVMIDPDRMAECFNELVANSLHWFDKSDKKINITVEKTRKKDLPETLDNTMGYLKIRFEDNGCGVPLENKDKIFAPFYTTYTHGTGLGLSLVKWIIEGHGGRIYENGKPEEGASFEMYLPIANKRRKR